MWEVIIELSHRYRYKRQSLLSLLIKYVRR